MVITESDLLDALGMPMAHYLGNAGDYKAAFHAAAVLAVYVLREIARGRQFSPAQCADLLAGFADHVRHVYQSTDRKDA